MKEKIIDMPDAREEQLLRNALNTLAEGEVCAAMQDETLDAEYERTLPGVQRHIAALAQAKPRRMRRGLRAVAVIAAVMVVFSGACLASEEVRENLFALVKQQWGRYGVLKLTYAGADATEQPEYAPTVDADDPRLENVWDKWCLHYYPLYIPEMYAYGRKNTWMPEEVGELNNWDEDFVNEAARKRMLEIDESYVTFTSTDEKQRNAITFVETGRVGAEFTFESETNDVSYATIDGKDVTIVHVGSSVRCYWLQDDHMLKFSGPQEVLTMDEIEKVITNVERIR